ncbi:MAG: 4-vinyl reductase [Deltaproteobacteria bacterium]|nr:4-vinyl reductase [Deltaproteobacteria bacterium]
MFKEDRRESRFCWDDLGDINEGRPGLGSMTSVAVYRLMQYTLRDVLVSRYDPDTAGQIFYEAGLVAGRNFYSNMLTSGLAFPDFIAELQKVMKDLAVGILRVEGSDLEKLEFTLCVYEDLDCSGLPMTDETVCDYDEGFIAGILETYTGKRFVVKEIDCWATGDRVCRFKARPAPDEG